MDLVQAKYWCDELVAQHQDRLAIVCMESIKSSLGADHVQARARQLYEQLASGGNVAAMKALAKLYAAGEGGPMDRPAACLLYLRLSLKGDQDATRALADLQKQLSPKEWEQVHKRMDQMHIGRREADAQ